MRSFQSKFAVACGQTGGRRVEHNLDVNAGVQVDERGLDAAVTLGHVAEPVGVTGQHVQKGSCAYGPAAGHR